MTESIFRKKMYLRIEIPQYCGDHLSSVRRVYDKFWKICTFYQKRANRNQDTVACNHTSVLKVFEIKPRLVHVDLIKSHLSHSGLILTFARLPKLINSYHMLIVEKPKCYFWLPCSLLWCNITPTLADRLNIHRHLHLTSLLSDVQCKHAFTFFYQQLVTLYW